MKKFILISASISVLAGCSVFHGQSDISNQKPVVAPSQTVSIASDAKGAVEAQKITATVDTNNTLYETDFAKQVIDNVKLKDAEIDLQVWRKTHKKHDPSSAEIAAEYDKIGGDLKEHQNLIKHYTDAIRLQGYLFNTPAKVLVNDEVTLIIIPNSWLWAGSFHSVSLVAKPYLKELGTYLSSSTDSIIAQSYLNNDEVILNKQALSSARAAKFAMVMTQYLDWKKHSIKGLGLGSVIDVEDFLKNSTVLELRSPYKINSTPFKPKAALNAFHWSE